MICSTAQYPVLSWWGILAVLQRAAATLTMVTVFIVGAILAKRGELSVGQIVSFVAFAVSADRQTRPAFRLRRARPSAGADVAAAVRLDGPSRSLAPIRADAKPLPPVKGTVRFDNVTLQLRQRAAGHL